MPQRTLAVALALLVTADCRREQPGPSTAAAAQDTAFHGTTVPIHHVRSAPPGVRLPTPAAGWLRAVEADANQGFDRVVFEFTSDSVPGYHVEYASGPVRRCG